MAAAPPASAAPSGLAFPAVAPAIESVPSRSPAFARPSRAFPHATAAAASATTNQEKRDRGSAARSDMSGLLLGMTGAQRHETGLEAGRFTRGTSFGSDGVCPQYGAGVPARQRGGVGGRLRVPRT